MSTSDAGTAGVATPLDYSIVIPVFNKAPLTRHCLATLRPTLDGAGRGEIIVVDNASSDETPAMLVDFPWVRVIRNERNLGFAAACNQGARAARGRFVVHLNNDTEGKPGWLAAMLRTAADPNVGIVGARLIFPDGTVQHAGVTFASMRFGPEGILPYHHLYQRAHNDPVVCERHDYQAVTGACLLTPRALFLELGGFDETYWNGYEDVDYCLKVGARGLRIVYEPDALLVHFESQSGIQRMRRVVQNVAVFSERWGSRVKPDHNTASAPTGRVRCELRAPEGAFTFAWRPVPPLTIVVHGAEPAGGADTFLERLRSSAIAIREIVWAARGAPPTARRADADAPGVRLARPGGAVAAVRREMELRGDRYVAIVDARCSFEGDWLLPLIEALEWGCDVGAASYAPEAPDDDARLLSADARCTLLALRQFPQHERLDEGFTTLDAAVGDFLLRAFARGRATRRAVMDPRRGAVSLPPRSVEEERFSAVHGAPLERFARDDRELAERLLTDAAAGAATSLASIVMLSWNAPQFTRLAIESIRAHTARPYEIIVVDNGSEPETIAYLKSLDDVTVIYNDRNLGFARGCNQGIAAARGERIVLLNNDVIVTDGWLDGLIRALELDPLVGVSAPRSNKIAGSQLVHDADYADIPAMHRYAAERRRRNHRSGYLTDRAIGFCLCIDRRVIDEIGGIDERYGTGNFEDDDFCVRVRAAGYRIIVCNDVFIHHFGHVSFQVNKVDWEAKMRENWTKFAAKWGLPREYPLAGYDASEAIRRGFDRARDHVALPASSPRARADESAVPLDSVGDAKPPYRRVFVATVSSERDWNEVGTFVRKYASAFSPADRVALAIAADGELDAVTLARRVERMASRAGVDADALPDVLLADACDLDAWLRELPDAPKARIADAVAEALRGVERVPDRSRSGLRRFVEGEPAAR